MATALPNTESEGLIHNHVLNKEKQIDKLIQNAGRPSIDIEINCHEENVNIICSPGFFNYVARPSLLNLSSGFQSSCEGITFELKSIFSRSCINTSK